MTEKNVHYSTVVEALDKLRRRGFTTDFNIQENCIVSGENRFDPADFEIVEIYRYEGTTDPGDEAVVYGIESTGGDRGVLVSGYGPTEDPMVTEIIGNMKVRPKEESV